MACRLSLVSFLSKNVERVASRMPGNYSVSSLAGDRKGFGQNPRKWKVGLGFKSACETEAKAEHLFGSPALETNNVSSQ